MAHIVITQLRNLMACSWQVIIHWLFDKTLSDFIGKETSILCITWLPTSMQSISELHMHNRHTNTKQDHFNVFTFLPDKELSNCH